MKRFSELPSSSASPLLQICQNNSQWNALSREQQSFQESSYFFPHSLPTDGLHLCQLEIFNNENKPFVTNYCILLSPVEGMTILITVMAVASNCRTRRHGETLSLISVKLSFLLLVLSSLLNFRFILFRGELSRDAVQENSCSSSFKEERITFRHSLVCIFVTLDREFAEVDVLS